MKKALLIALMISVFILTGCGVKTVTKTEYICPAVTVPEEPQYEQVQWRKMDGNYCLDIINAKKLIKNFLLLQAYKEELKLLLGSICEGD